MKFFRPVQITLALFFFGTLARAENYILQPAAFAKYIAHFNSMEDENVTNLISNADSWDWLQKEIPFFECPDPAVEELYYYRWWSFRKHLAQTSHGFVLPEFLTRATPVSSGWATKSPKAAGCMIRTISILCPLLAAIHQGPQAPSQIQQLAGRRAVSALSGHGDRRFVVRCCRLWSVTFANGNRNTWPPMDCFGNTTCATPWRNPSAVRARTRISAPPSTATCLATPGHSRHCAAGRQWAVASEFKAKAAKLKQLVEAQLWNPDASFFEVRRDNGKFSEVREEIGFIPWYFELPDRQAKICGRLGATGRSAGIFRALRHHHRRAAASVIPHAWLWTLRMGRRRLALCHVANAGCPRQLLARLCNPEPSRSAITSMPF